MEKVRLGIIGIGNMGGNHLGSISDGKEPEIEVTAIADLKESQREWGLNRVREAREAGHDVKDPAVFKTGDELIESGLCDAVVVAVPHYDHPRYVTMALEHGMHAMSEKPAGVYTAQVKEEIAVADSHPDLTFAMMFNQRTNPAFRKMRELIAGGELGAIRRTSWIITNWYRPQAYYDSGDWRATWSGEGGGVLLNQCPHNLDLWQWICGMPVKVDAKLHFGKWHDIEVEDDVTAYVEYANGATGTFITSTGDAPGVNRFEVVCDGGTLVTNGGEVTLTKLEMYESEFTKINKVPFGKVPFKVGSVELDPVNEATNQHVGVMNAFAAHILHGTPLVADGREGINGLTISNAMHLSAWLGRAVDLPFDDQLFKAELFKRVATSRRKTTVSGVMGDVNGTF